MTDDHSKSVKVAKILDQTAVKAFSLPDEEVLASFDEAERECLAFTKSEHYRREVKRRSAEWKMEIFCDRNRPFHVVNGLHEDIAALGFSNLEREAAIEIYFALYCIRNEQTGTARQLMQILLSKLKEALKTENTKAHRYYRDYVSKMLQKLEKKS